MQDTSGDVNFSAFSSPVVMLVCVCVTSGDICRDMKSSADAQADSRVSRTIRTPYILYGYPEYINTDGNM